MSRENDIMNNDGVKKAILTYDNVFLNSDNIFIEFDDIISCPFFILLHTIKNNELFNDLFDMSEVADYSIEELYEWYVNRKQKNILMCFPVREGIVDKLFNGDNTSFFEWCDKFLYSELDTIPELINQGTELNFYNTLKILLSKKIVKNTYIYTEYYSKTVEEYIKKEFGDNVKYVYGYMSKVIEDEKISSNSTFVVSNINNIHHLIPPNVLNLSSIVIADRYGYNYNDEENLVVDLDSLYKEAVFKIDFFNNIERLEDIEEE